MKKILLIDTSSNQKVKVGLQVGREVNYLTSEVKVLKAQAVLPLLDKLLKKKRLQTSDIDAVEVHTGPGSFTGLRVGVAIANTLGFALNIPVNKKKNGEIVTPAYEARPQ